MNNTQKWIKYGALAFAAFLIFTIISGIMFGLSIITNTSNDYSDQLKSFDIDNKISLINIDINTSNLTIKSGKELKVHTDNKYIDIKQKGNQLIVNEKKRNIFFNSKNSNLIIDIPSNITFDEVMIDSGMGNIKIETLSAKKLDMDLGIGNVTIDQLEVFKKAKIDSGIGQVNIKQGTIHNLDLDGGVGNISLNAHLFKTNKIDGGIGKIDLVLLGDINNYRIKASKGIGTITIDGKKAKSKEVHGTGNNQVSIDGGVGTIKVAYEK